MHNGMDTPVNHVPAQMYHHMNRGRRRRAMSIAVKQADTATPLEEQQVAGRRGFSLSLLRYVPGLGLLALAAVLYSRKGYGPFGDPAQRSKPCTVSRCAHNATVALVAGLVALGLPRAKRYRQDDGT
jgi:hypothetical protein